MITEFEDRLQADAHAQFQAWRRTNPSGFFLNCKSPLSYVLHHVDCTHSGDTIWEAAEFSQSLTRSAKICSTEADELSRWATERGATVKNCGDCLSIRGAS